MIYFTSSSKVRKLPFLQKLWMTPIAYMLKYMAGLVVYLGGKFDEKVAGCLINDLIKGR